MYRNNYVLQRLTLAIEYFLAQQDWTAI